MWGGEGGGGHGLAEGEEGCVGRGYKMGWQKEKAMD